ncbi:hypothetical protein Cgig2_005842 [Carnegiea gigantea]|uniref:RNase H type-1 domain-containing protein n=1 Tax=Carnegiea gigantea TaxID=171969 RepID=A0A9Q1QLU0_9CARY|nr:hypothetical protein Cgig2_005842 [Carnegiea gigantea]
MWWQRARTDFLKFRDLNRRWFHSRASMRRTKNVISKLQDADGVVYMDADKLEHIVVDYFTQLFTGASTLPITPRLVHKRVCKVSELIDANRGWWDLIMSISLSDSMPRDKLIWHNIAKRITNFNMNCLICGFDCESETHILLHCPLAKQIWEGTSFEKRLWQTQFRTIRDCVEKAIGELGEEDLGLFMAIIWECWNARNRFIFKKADHNPSVLSKRVSSLGLSYREMKASSEQPKSTFPTLWKPPLMGILKLNFDGGKVGEDSWGWGFVIRSFDGDVVLAGAQQGPGFAGPTIEEARACLSGLQSAHDQGFLNLVVEVDCPPLIQKLQNKLIKDNVLGLFIIDILQLVAKFDCVSFMFVKKGGNRVAHELTHQQPLCYERRVWVDDVPDDIVSWASDDMVAHIESNLI